MSSKQIELPGIGAVTLYKRRGNRSLRLSISAAGEVRVSLPYWLSYRAAEQFVQGRQQWITANRPEAAPVLRHGQAVGKAHRLHLEPTSAAARVVTRIKDNEIRINFPSCLSPAEPAVQQAARAASVRALRKEAEALLPQRLNTLSRQTGLDYHSVHIKHLKSRWGSCNTSKEIALNLYLMQLPWHLIDYVLLHELTHTKVMRHGPPFWAELARHLPEAKTLKKEISQHQPVLLARAA